MRILFHLSQFKIGGGEMSTLRLLNALSNRGAQVTLVVTEGGGALEPRLDPRIELVILRPRWLRSFTPAKPLRLAWGWVRAAALGARRYDAGVIGMTGASPLLVRHLVRARTRFHFIRSDLSHTSETPRIARAVRSHLDAFDGYICVSEVARQSLIAAVPEAAPKARVVYNILNPARMVSRASEGGDPFPPRRPGALRILSVCRLQEHAKGLIRMARVCARLDEAGLDFDWFVMGEGPDRALFEAAISSEGVSHRMHVLGSIDNPFPGYAAADLVAMVSKYEGLCGVVNEAKIMGRPILATRVSGIDEQLVDGETGLIVEQSEDAIFAGLALLIRDEPLRRRLTNNRLPAALLDDETKLDTLWALFSGAGDPSLDCQEQPS